MIRVQIVGDNVNRPLNIDEEGNINVVTHTHPPLNETSIAYPFRSYMKNSAGSSDMIVDGSVTPQNFYVAANSNRDIFIKCISWRLGDTGTMNLSTFGALSALTNGCELVYQNDALGEITIADQLKTNLAMVRLGTSTAPVGTGADAFLLDVQSGGAEDTYLPFMDMSQMFGFQWGLRLAKGSNDRLTFRIKDALAGLITFNAICYGVTL